VCLTYGDQGNSLGYLECWDGAQGRDLFFEFTGNGCFVKTSACGGLGIPEPIWLGFRVVDSVCLSVFSIICDVKLVCKQYLQEWKKEIEGGQEKRKEDK